MSFTTRNAQAIAFENEVIERLHRNGWHAEQFGQGQMSEYARELLRRFVHPDPNVGPTLIRWMPDILAGRMYGEHAYVALIDAKVCGEQYSNQAIEIKALEAAEVFEQLHIPCFYVFSNWKVVKPAEARRYGYEGRPSRNGSGTPYLLFEKDVGEDFERFFGAKTDA